MRRHREPTHSPAQGRQREQRSAPRRGSSHQAAVQTRTEGAVSGQSAPLRSGPSAFLSAFGYTLPQNRGSPRFAGCFRPSNDARNAGFSQMTGAPAGRGGHRRASPSAHIFDRGVQTGGTCGIARPQGPRVAGAHPARGPIRAFVRPRCTDQPEEPSVPVSHIVPGTRKPLTTGAFQREGRRALALLSRILRATATFPGALLARPDSFQPRPRFCPIIWRRTNPSGPGPGPPKARQNGVPKSIVPQGRTPRTAPRRWPRSAPEARASEPLPRISA